MTNRLIIPLLAAASVAFARSTATHKETLAASPVSHNTKSLLTSKFTVNSNHGVEFNLDIRNNTAKMIELNFVSGMTHDFVVIDANGKEVWRWSADRMFTQAMQNDLVKSREVTTYSEAWDAKDVHGKFTAIATLKSENHPIEERVDFELK